MMLRRPLVPLAAAAALGLTACGDDAPSRPSATGPAGAPDTSPVGTTQPGTTTLPSAPPSPGTAAGTSPTPATPGTTGDATTPAGSMPDAPPATANPDVVPSVGVDTIGEFDAPVDLAVRPGDPARYVVEQAGRVIRADDGDTADVLDITDLTDADGERGLLGLAFHPTQPVAYVNYTDADTGSTVVAEYAVGAEGGFDGGSGRVVLEIDQPYPNHNGGGLAFGPDGFLYIGTGDGGSRGDPERRATDPFDLLGKLLRIDPHTDGPTAYAVPSDNPYADGAAGAPEVWALGLRNPWRFGFDEPTGDLWIADVGQADIEEINRVTPTAERPAGYGAHFGWSAYEGNARYNDDVAEPARHTAPVWTYSHDDGCSVSGGMVYRGAAVPDLDGWYLYADYCAGTLWGYDAATGRNIELATGLGPVTAVRPGPDGEAYVLTHDGPILRVTGGA